jgi:8-hydroxy-5-deazaflavin:NADPH oxidoreductase
MKIGILGTGAVATKLAGLLAAQHHVVMGSRTPAAPEGMEIRKLALADAVTDCDIVIVAVPFIAAREMLPMLAAAIGDAIVIDATNPLNDDWSPLQLGPENSAGEEIARLLPQARVVKALNTIFADIMTPAGIDRAGSRATAFIAGDDSAATATVSSVLGNAGFAPLATGPLKNARYLEAMAHLNIAIAVGQSGGTDAAFLYDRDPR